METPAMNSIRAVKRDRNKMSIRMTVIFLAVFITEIIVAYFVIYKDGLVMGDAVSRTANAYFVLFLEPPKLASIGFVWNPLPSLIQLLIVPFSVFWKPLATVGFAGAIATSLFAAINASLLFRYFRQAGLSSLVALVIVSLYAFNPFIFYYGFNGMSETFFFTCMIVSTANFALWIDGRETGRLVTVALMMALGFLIRYEVIALMLGFGLALVIAIYLLPDRKSPFTNKPAQMKRSYTVATGTLLFLPVIYTVLIWMFLNWSIMGDPLFFFHSAYSNESQSTVALFSGFRDSIQNPFDALLYVIVHMLPFFLPIFAIVIERIMTKRLFKPDLLILVLLIGAITGFHWVMLMMGKSFGWLRFYCFALPFCIAWMPYELTQLSGSMKKRTVVMLCVSLLLSATMIPYYFINPQLAPEEYGALYASEPNRIEMQLEVSEEINRKYAESTILADAFMSYSVIVGLDNPRNLITNVADEVFDLAVENPREQGIDYVVVPTNLMDDRDPSLGLGGTGTLDAINERYPRLYQYGARWADLVFAHEYYKIYKVLRYDEATNDLIEVVNNKYGDATLLFDNSTTGMLRTELDNPENAITLMSEHFYEAVVNPREYGVEYIIVPIAAVDESGSMDEINRVYPELMAEGVDWAELVEEDEVYRVYKVLYPDDAEEIGNQAMSLQPLFRGAAL